MNAVVNGDAGQHTAHAHNDRRDSRAGQPDNGEAHEDAQGGDDEDEGRANVPVIHHEQRAKEQGRERAGPSDVTPDEPLVAQGMEMPGDDGSFQPIGQPGQAGADMGDQLERTGVVRDADGRLQNEHGGLLVLAEEMAIADGGFESDGLAQRFEGLESGRPGAQRIAAEPLAHGHRMRAHHGSSDGREGLVDALGGDPLFQAGIGFGSEKLGGECGQLLHVLRRRHGGGRCDDL